MKITQQEIVEAIAEAAPKEGQPWDSEKISESIVRLVEREAKVAREEQAEWEAGRKDFGVRFKPSGVVAGDPDAAAAARQVAVLKHGQAVAAKIETNRKLIAGIGASVVALATAALSGGATTPVLVTGAMSIAREIADALNQ